MSECAKCNGWGVDDVTGFACPSCRTVKDCLTVEPVSNPDGLGAAMQADAAPVAWMYDNGGGQLALSFSQSHAKYPYWTETPLYTADRIEALTADGARGQGRVEPAKRMERDG